MAEVVLTRGIYVFASRILCTFIPLRNYLHQHRRGLKRSYLTPLVNQRIPILENGQQSPLDESLVNPPAKANLCTFRISPSSLPFCVKYVFVVYLRNLHGNVYLEVTPKDYWKNILILRKCLFLYHVAFHAARAITWLWLH